MPGLAYRFFDNNTGEEVFASDDFDFADAPTVNHRIKDPDLMTRYGGPAIINRIEQGEVNKAGSIEYRIYIDGSEERLNSQDIEQNYRRS
ncbi:hypothetical protein PQU92_01780 [Asticcacaulis sp. BYS171W]|uniref:Uncharacterized protein n=1 Tax=Asticcacaulis aquaticus TaxID=2984212 RepID=A0ABT5HPS3_9CAUL|nr:hypothetical protein [Asticcacaulis aquaticus]MDC7681984.1 hypothetical protein [Asticcacaulis aquaticus]